MNYGSVCSGIEAASVAWEPLGFKPSWFAEIEKFPSQVLAHHWPNVENLGDMTEIYQKVFSGSVDAPEILVGGTPCQAFSVAGLRKGLLDARGQLTLSYVVLLNAIDEKRRSSGLGECVAVWENVPGVLSSKDNAFGCFLGALAGESEPLQPSGTKWSNAGCVFGPERAIAWRILDAQYFGVAQRRRRVFLIASARENFDPTKVLFEFDGVRRDSAPSREQRKEVAGNAESCTGAGSHWDSLVNPHPTLNQSHNTGGIGASNQELFSQRGAGIVPHGFRMVAFGEYADDESASTMKARDYKDATHLAVAFAENSRAELRLEGGDGRRTGALSAGGKPGQGTPVIAFHHNAQADQLPTSARDTSVSDPLTCSQQAAASIGIAVRRLTPTECERLQGFPDGYTKINEKTPDGPRYKALGNSMAVPCMHWIGKRLKNYMESPCK